MMVSFLLTTIAGISTLIGYLFIFIKVDKNKIIPISLGFSAGIMIIISTIDLLPQSYNYFNFRYVNNVSLKYSFFFFILGMALAISMRSIFKEDKKSNLYRIGILSFITLLMHNIPEGIITYLTTTIDLKMGVLMCLSIAMHNIPEGICIAIPIYYSTGSKKKAFMLVLLSAISELFGAIIAHLFLEPFLTPMIIAVLLALVAGIMILLAVTELLKEGKNYSFKLTVIFLIIGLFIGFMSHLLF